MSEASSFNILRVDFHARNQKIFPGWRGQTAIWVYREEGGPRHILGNLKKFNFAEGGGEGTPPPPLDPRMDFLFVCGGFFLLN